MQRQAQSIAVWTRLSRSRTCLSSSPQITCILTSTALPMPQTHSQGPPVLLVVETKTMGRPHLALYLELGKSIRKHYQVGWRRYPWMSRRLATSRSLALACSTWFRTPDLLLSTMLRTLALAVLARNLGWAVSTGLRNLGLPPWTMASNLAVLLSTMMPWSLGLAVSTMSSLNLTSEASEPGWHERSQRRLHVAGDCLLLFEV
mmetsp:Transcript_41487/g.63907  ORF Transcript_41487/g.63907 Transcript_41487/m.63907 type:complete len:203 (-) Transcript_41487:11-619(-)